MFKFLTNSLPANFSNHFVTDSFVHSYNTRKCADFHLFSERELTFTFAICRRPSVCHLSSVCNVRAPYSGDSNFRQYFYDIWYVGHLRPFGKNFTEIVPGNPSVGGVKHKSGSRI